MSPVPQPSAPSDGAEIPDGDLAGADGDLAGPVGSSAGNDSASPVADAAAGVNDGAFAGLSILVTVDDDAWLAQGLGDLAALVRKCAVAAARVAEVPADVVTEFSATFTDDAAVKVLNAEWRGKDKPTNVLSFPMLDLIPGDRPGAMLGDIVLARETVMAEARSEEKSLNDHFCHLVVHGFLHCLGFDHVDPEDADEMEGLEIDILSDLGIADPYAAAGAPIDETERTADRR